MLRLSSVILHGVRSLRQTITAMSSYAVPLQPPSAFHFDHPNEWGKWKRRFEQFCLVSGLAAESEERQVSTLLYTVWRETLEGANFGEMTRKTSLAK